MISNVEKMCLRCGKAIVILLLIPTLVFAGTDFSGVIYFTDDGVIDNMITKGIWRKIHRLQIPNREGTEQEAIDFKITHLPTFIFIENGKEIGRYRGIIDA